MPMHGVQQATAMHDQLVFLLLQVAQFFAWVDNLSEGKLCVSTTLQTQADRALYFTRDTERLILPGNIQVSTCLD